MRITIETKSYNERRDGKPWIARVTSWAVGSPRPEIIWGAFIGKPGSAGTLEIAAEPGDLLRHGQNDLRRNNHTYRQYCLVLPDGSARAITDKFARTLSLLPIEERIPSYLNYRHSTALAEDSERSAAQEAARSTAEKSEAMINPPPAEPSTDIGLYSDLCALFSAALNTDLRARIEAHAREAFTVSGGHRLTAIEYLQVRTGIPRRMSEEFCDALFAGGEIHA